jgi:hypothetical protein
MKNVTLEINISGRKIRRALSERKINFWKSGGTGEGGHLD